TLMMVQYRATGCAKFLQNARLKGASNVIYRASNGPGFALVCRNRQLVLRNCAPPTSLYRHRPNVRLIADQAEVNPSVVRGDRQAIVNRIRPHRSDLLKPFRSRVQQIDEAIVMKQEPAAVVKPKRRFAKGCQLFKAGCPKRVDRNTDGGVVPTVDIAGQMVGIPRP